MCLKINMKLNGKNAVLRDPLPLVSLSPTIIIGADVEQPRSGQGSRPLIAAVVTRPNMQRLWLRKKLQLPNMMHELFRACYESTNRKPKHVVYYRDGASEGEILDILQAKMRALRKACKMMSENYNPLVTFVVVNKRHHFRAFAANQHDVDKKVNVMPGTVIDTGVVDPYRLDFFLYGHSGIQDTTVPAHYTVLHDENDMSAEEIQRLMYHLSYTFSSCTRSIFIVVPACYAQLAAEHARFFLNEGDSYDASTGSNNSNMVNFQFAKVHPNVINSIFYI